MKKNLQEPAVAPAPVLALHSSAATLAPYRLVQPCACPAGSFPCRTLHRDSKRQNPGRNCSPVFTS